MAADGSRKRKKEPLSDGEKRRLRQLLVCVVLFGIVFIGRGVDLEPVVELSSKVGTLVGADTDFQAVFSRLEDSFAQGEARETLQSLWTGLFPEDRDGLGGEDGETQGT